MRLGEGLVPVGPSLSHLLAVVHVSVSGFYPLALFSSGLLDMLVAREDV